MQIMTRHKKQLLTIILTALAFTISSCVNELANNDKNAENKDAQKEFNAKAFAGTANAPKTKTSGKYTLLESGKNGIRFFWDTDDHYRLWVDMGGTKGWQSFQSQDTLDSEDGKITQARFLLPPKFQLTEDTYPLWYSNQGVYGGKIRYTFIPYNHTQNKPNDFSNLRDQGACGFATATDNGIWYAFTLQHATSYITFMPYAGDGSSKTTLQKCILTQITLTCDESNQGYFYFDENGELDESKRPGKGRYTRTIYCATSTSETGFSIPGSKDEAKDNAAIMVMPPGVYHNVEVAYTLYDPIVQTKGVFKKSIPELVLKPGKNKPMFSKLEAEDFTSRFGLYHMWGAKLYFWDGAHFPSHEWRPGGINAQPGAPKLGDTRYYNPAHTNGPNNIAPAGTIDHNSPSANLLSWYVKYGDPRWDDSPFTYDGHLFTGRMWFLKQKHIAKLVGFSEAEMNQKMNEKAANGSDFRSSGYGGVSQNSALWSKVPEGKRSNYFFVMPLGYYDSTGRLYMDANYEGRYWASTAVTYKNYEYYAYFLRIRPGYAELSGNDSGDWVKYNGYQLWPGEN